MRIYGAGIAGLLSGCVFPTAEIFEGGPERSVNHKALLRFRSSAVGDAVGIDFRKVRVHKGIWHDGKFVEPDIQMANFYSQKVIGRLADRSIWNLAPSDRFIAPENFIEQLIDRCWNRIHWFTKIDSNILQDHISDGGPIISTLPMPVMVYSLGYDLENPNNIPEFNRAPITVKRWRVKNSDVFQTIYFPSSQTTLYRASITKDLLIAEYVGRPEEDQATYWLRAFGLSEDDIEPLETVSQNFGKIAPIDDAWRKDFIFRLTTDTQIYSLGRFGTWRNILTDDLIKDITVIKKLMGTSHYDRSRRNAD